LEGRPASAIREVQDFCYSVGLPLCLEDLDIVSPTPEEIRQVAAAAVAVGETVHSTWFPVMADMVEAAVWTADALGMRYKKGLR
jgi:glycerol dehydrogenase